MWVLRGPFDVDPVTSLESKLRILKPSKSYLLGRKKTPYPQLIINNKKFSHEHCKFSVGQFTREDVVNPHKKPTLEITNLRDKPISIRRNVKGEDGTIVVNGKMTVKLQDGDEVLLVGGMKPIAIFWRFNMFLYRPNSAQLESCASLGITISQIPQQSELGSSSPVSHHILPSFAITPAVGISLLSRASFVKVEWLNRFIELYNNVSNNPNANNPDMHPDTPPDLADPPLPLEKFRPSFPSTLDAKYKNATVWEPNEARSDFFKGFRFLLVCEKDRDLELGLREFLKCGGGAVDTFRVSEGRSKFKRALKQGLAKGDTMLVLVGDEGNVKAAIGDDEWRELEAEAKEYNLRLFTLVDIVYAVLDVDTEVLKSVPRSEIEEESQAGSSHPPPSSFLPSYVPNSIPEEMTVPPPTAPPPPPTEDPNELHEADVSRRRPLQRRKPLSRQVSVAPEESTDTQPVDNNAPSEPAESEEPAPAPARRKPTRRVRGGVPIVTGLGDSSMVIDAIEAANAAEIIPKTEPPPTAAPMILDLAVDPTPIRSSRPLKRRQGPSAASSSSATFSAASEEEPPHKKYKALFEATNDPEQADMLMSQLPQEDYAGSRQTQSRTQSETQSQTGSRKTQSGASRSRQIQLDPVPEEGSSQFPSSKQTQSRKRKVVHSDDEDREMAGVEQELAATGTRSRGGSVAPPSKKQATEKVNAVEPVATASVNGKENASSKSQAPTSKKGSKGAGAVPSQPDTDPSFLKAVASTKRGKKNEDEFDREFNQLRISKPNTKDAQSNREEEDWAILNRDDFELEDGQNLRGNFMVIVEMDVHRDRFPEADKDRERREKESREKWAGVPNFKKFKKKNVSSKGRKIELFVSENQGYDLGNRPDDLSIVEQSRGIDRDLDMDHVGQDQHFDDDEPPRAGNRRAKTGSSSRARTQERALTADDSDEDGFSAVTQTKSRKGVASRGGSASRASSTPPSTRTRATAGTGRSTRASKSSTKSSQPLFVDDSDDNSIVEVHDMSDIEEAPEDGDDDMTLPSTLPAKRKPNIRTVRDAKSTKGSSSKSKKQIPIIVDSDSDEDAFKGFKGR